jgi:FtsP/CotA-like multicopper oxidase with cupredoxin domain
VNFNYNTATDSRGLTLYCFTTPDGKESPTLHLNPGDTLVVNVTNRLPVPAQGSSMLLTTNLSAVCGDAYIDPSSVNMHFHGTNTSPACHSDEVIHTLINSGETFSYTLVIPPDEPPGLYWYHPHVHGLAEAAVLGGASGAIEVNGIQNVVPSVAGLPERFIVIRDQVLPDGSPDPGGTVPSWDLSVNYSQILYPAEVPPTVAMRPGEKQLWRVVNASADTILQLQLLYNNVLQPIQVVALDGVPVSSLNGTSQAITYNEGSLMLPPAGRVEFIITGPGTTVNTALLRTMTVNAGPDGDNDPQRNLLYITRSATAPEPNLTVPAVTTAVTTQRFSGLATATPVTTRQIYFSEDNPNSQFFITVQGATPTLFNANLPPAIVAKQGTVEDWVISNRTLENHEFHMHQIHFLLLERDGVPVSPNQQQMLDTIDIPFWSGNPKQAYHTVKVRMDFRGPDTGDFVYHCHILEHEDLGMMAIIRVIP